jgi:hypothetical protein
MNFKVDLAAAANQYNTPSRPMGAKSKETGAFLNVGDDTSRVGKQDMGTFTERLAEAFKSDNAEIIRALDELSESDKMEIAMRSYLQMQGRIYSAKNKEESDIKKFSSLKEEKSYYTDMLEKAQENGTAEIKDEKDARFAFSDKKAGEKVSTQDIEKALEDVQGRIDNFLYPYGRNEDGSAMSSRDNELMTRDYIAYASAFKEVTGLDADCLDPGDSLYLNKLDRNEDNFIEKARANINALDTMSNSLRDLMKQYRDEQETEIGGGDLSEEARTRMEAFDYVREQFVYGDQKTELKTLGILDVKA